MFINRKGCTRTVLVFNDFVIKIPTLNSWELFLHGLLANITEERFSRELDNRLGLVPMYYGSKLGMYVVSKRAREVKHRGLFWVELGRLAALSDLHPDFWYHDAKPENFGYINNQLVKIDLG